MYSRARLMRLRACDASVVRHPTLYPGVQKLRGLALGLWTTAQNRAVFCRVCALTGSVRSLSLRLDEVGGGDEQFAVSFHMGADVSSGAADSATGEVNGRLPASLLADAAPRCNTPGLAPHLSTSEVHATADDEKGVAAMGAESRIMSSVASHPTVSGDGSRDDGCHPGPFNASVAAGDANSVDISASEALRARPVFVLPAPPHVHSSTESMLSRKKPQVRTSFVSHTGAGADGSVTSTAAAAACPTAASVAARSSTEPITTTHALYSDLFRDSFVNPFNGRLVNKSSPTARLLFGVGFYQGASNPLQLEWSPAEYLATLQKLQFAQQRKAARQQEREERRAAKAAAVAAATEDGKSSSSSGSAKSKAGGSPAKSPVKYRAPAIISMPVDEAMEAARSQLLRPFLRLGPDHWTASVARLLERKDVFTYLNRDLERLYSRLKGAYIPPKLDAPLDTSTKDMTLTPDQHQVMQLAMRGFNLFVGGSAGTGKTVLLKCIYRELSQLGLRVAMTATTGVAAVQLGGCTFHHAFNAPLDTSPHRWDANALRAVDVVVIDEVSLLDACMLDAFDMEARLARMHHSPFGGLQLIACGDFLQLSHEETRPAYESAAFQQLVALRLVTPMRHTADIPLMKLLEELRRGRFDATSFAALDRPIPENATHITYLFPRRREAQQLNDTKLCELTTQEMVFTPQRGPLHLCGIFTHSALVELSSDANGMRTAMPQRERLLEMVNEEATRLRAGWHHKDSNGKESASQVADHELVLMPVRVGGTPGTRFVLRLRCRERELPTSAARGRGGVDPDNGGSGIPTHSLALAACDTSALISDSTHSSSLATTTTTTTSVASCKSLINVAAKRTRRLAAPFTDAEWEEIATAIATRLGGRLVAMLEEEPPHMVPLSVSMTLADMTSSEVAISLMPLRLKLGCRVMVNRNLSRTVLNGSVGVVEAFAPPDINLFPRRINRSMRAMFQRICEQNLFTQLPIVRLLDGEVVQIPPVSIVLGGTAQSYFYAHEVLTIPLQLGYAFTVHKVQGLTLQGTVVLDCERFFDCPHLIYVACSRVRRLDQLIVHHVQPNMIIVRRSALEFSDRLQDASDSNLLASAPTAARASWPQNTPQRIFALSA
ncbi:hypothetical protein JKF63_03680 [Porcisia hertigi]|uniref:ATP-dependent DNA helicase n=1 Tax=Porcisia hertigi TaxID=2761500 RepID=A0A836L9U3_9TRYP|nr:hypothetical protein JKF63_03680 [Porcisia hertigi]